MRISADLEKLIRHQEILLNELETTNRLLEYLENKVKCTTIVDNREAEIYMKHIRFVQDFRENIILRQKLLAEIYDILLEAKQIMCMRISDARSVLEKL